MSLHKQLEYIGCGTEMCVRGGKCLRYNHKHQPFSSMGKYKITNIWHFTDPTPTLFLYLSLWHQQTYAHALLLSASPLVTHTCTVTKGGPVFYGLYQLAGGGDAWQTLRCVTKMGLASQAFPREWTLPDQDSNLQHCYCTLVKCEQRHPCCSDAVFAGTHFLQPLVLPDL